MKMSERSFTKTFSLETNFLPTLLRNGYMKEIARFTKEIDIFNFRVLNYIIEEEKLLFPKPRTRKLLLDSKERLTIYLFYVFIMILL